jgi:hypothetical protein
MNLSRGALRTIGFLLGGLLVLTLALFVWVQTVAYTSWTKRVTAAVDEARAKDPRRPLLRGAAIPGNAWMDYEQALAAVKGVAVDDVRRWLDGAAASDPVKAKAILAANEKALHFLHAGARKAEGGYPIQWEKGFSAPTPSLIAVRTLTTLAVGRARVLAEAGKPKEAAELLLDTAQLGADLGRRATVITELIALSSLREVLDALRKLPPDPEVGRALAVLDETFPNHGDALLNEIALAGMGFMETGPGDVAPGAGAWRFGFSQRLMLADAWTTLQDMTRRLAVATTAPWAEAQRVAAAVRAEAKSSSNQVIQVMVPELGTADRVSREARAQLRLLRVLHGGAAGLDDPFGGKLLSDGARIWSVGSDGVDNGGAGTWNPAASTGDIVLTLPAR